MGGGREPHNTDDDWDRLQRTERRLRSLQQTTQKLMVAASREEIADATIVASREVLDQPVASLWQYDESRDALICVKHSAAAQEILGEPPDAFEQGEGLVWEAFEDGDVRTYEDLHDKDETYNPETPLRSELMAPIGGYGIILAASTEPASFDDLDLDMGQILAANVEAAFERLEREQALRKRQRDLELLEQLLSRFLRHNLRNKIALIQTHAEVIAEQVDSALREQIRQILTACDELVGTSKKAQYVQRLVDQDPSISEQDLEKIVIEAINRIDDRPEVTIEHDIPSGLSVAAIPQITRAVENLLSNAVVHGGPEVRVTASETDTYVELVIVDDGPGIPQHEIDVLTRREETKLKHSSGMGLWLVDWIVDRSNGEFVLTRDNGTRALIRLQPGTAV